MHNQEVNSLCPDVFFFFLSHMFILSSVPLVSMQEPEVRLSVEHQNFVENFTFDSKVQD